MAQLLSLSLQQAIKLSDRVYSMENAKNKSVVRRGERERGGLGMRGEPVCVILCLLALVANGADHGGMIPS